MLGFTYNGKHSSEFGVYYVTDATDRGDFFSDYEVVDSERSWIDGGDYYKTRVKSRDFTLPAYYDNVTYETREKIIKWLDRNTSGYLIFDSRPWARYFVRPSKRITPKDYLQNPNGDKTYSGTFDITFTAYYPFADLLYTTSEDVPSDDASQNVYSEAYIIPEASMPSAVTTSSTDCWIFNPGTEVGHSVIRFAGSTGSSAFTIYNSTNGTKFTLEAGLETDSSHNAYYEIQSRTAKVIKVDSVDGNTIDFTYHNDGYITFEPSEKYDKISVTTTSGSRIITSDVDCFTSDMEGKYIGIDGTWRYISSVDSSKKITVNTNSESTSSNVDAYIASLNYLTITKASDANITKLEIICRPEVR